MVWYIPQDLSSYVNPGEDFLVKPSRGALGILGGSTSDQKMLFSTLAPVVQKLDSAIHRISHYPVLAKPIGLSSGFTDLSCR